MAIAVSTNYCQVCNKEIIEFFGTPNSPKDWFPFNLTACTASNGMFKYYFCCEEHKQEWIKRQNFDKEPNG
jgi:hypothetical protein